MQLEPTFVIKLKGQNRKQAHREGKINLLFSITVTSCTCSELVIRDVKRGITASNEHLPQRPVSCTKIQLFVSFSKDTVKQIFKFLLVFQSTLRVKPTETKNKPLKTHVCSHHSWRQPGKQQQLSHDHSCLGASKMVGLYPEDHHHPHQTQNKHQAYRQKQANLCLHQ